MFTIKEVTKRLNMTVHTVRHYCDKGLVPNLQYDDNGNRLFDEEAINWLQAALFLKNSGMKLSDIQHYFQLCQEGMATIEERQSIMSQLRHKAEEDLANAQYRFDCLVRQEAFFEEVKTGKADDSTNPLNWD